MSINGTGHGTLNESARIMLNGTPDAGELKRTAEEFQDNAKAFNAQKSCGKSLFSRMITKIRDFVSKGCRAIRSVFVREKPSTDIGKK